MVPLPEQARGGSCRQLPSPRLVHQRAHPLYHRRQPVEDRLADQEMADIELADLRDRGDRDDIVERQAVAGMRLDAVLGGKRGGIGDSLELGRTRVAVEFAIAAGMNLDDRRAQAERRRRCSQMSLPWQ